MKASLILMTALFALTFGEDVEIGMARGGNSMRQARFFWCLLGSGRSECKSACSGHKCSATCKVKGTFFSCEYNCGDIESECVDSDTTDAPAPTTAPTEAPTTAPTDAPTTAPTDAPTTAPTDAPTTAPTDAPPAACTNNPGTNIEVCTCIGAGDKTAECTKDEACNAGVCEAKCTESATPIAAAGDCFCSDGSTGGATCAAADVCTGNACSSVCADTTTVLGAECFCQDQAGTGGELCAATKFCSGETCASECTESATPIPSGEDCFCKDNSVGGVLCTASQTCNTFTCT